MAASHQTPSTRPLLFNERGRGLVCSSAMATSWWRSTYCQLHHQTIPRLPHAAWRPCVPTLVPCLVACECGPSCGSLHPESPHAYLQQPAQASHSGIKLISLDSFLAVPNKEVQHPWLITLYGPIALLNCTLKPLFTYRRTIASQLLLCWLHSSHNVLSLFSCGCHASHEPICRRARLELGRKIVHTR